MTGWPVVVAAWCGIAIALALGKAIRLSDQAQDDDAVYDDDLTALVQPESWSQTAVDEAFFLMVPDFATEAWFE